MAMRPVLWGPICVGTLMLASLWTSHAMAGGGTNVQHRLKAFDLHLYGNITDASSGSTSSWKEDYCPSCAYGTSNPWYAYSLYDTLITNCNGGTACANSTSSRWQDSNSTVNQFHTAVLNNAADLVVFMGHHISMRRWDAVSNFKVWVPWDTKAKARTSYYNGSWVGVMTGTGLADVANWGFSTALPYYYHQRGTILNGGYNNALGIHDAVFGDWPPTQPSAPCWSEDPNGVHHGEVFCTTTGTTSKVSYGVQYMYNPTTSVLIGQDYKTGTWTTENDNNTNATSTNRSGQLGSGLGSSTNGVKWYIGNGCQLVPVAWYEVQNTSTGLAWASDKARQQWLPSWNGAHMALGHYADTSSSCLPNMINVGNSMMGGLDMVESYFDNHSATYTSCHDPNEEGFGMPSVLGPDGNILWNETWTSPMANPSSQSGAWTSYFEVAE